MLLVSSSLFGQNIKFTLYNMANTPAFTTNSFRQVAVGKDSTIWVGTAGSGLYRFDGTSWAKAPVLLTHSMRTIMRAPDSSIVIGQSGYNAVQATNGGVDRFTTTAFTNTHYGMGNGLPSRYVNGLCISNNGTIWAGNGQDLTGSTTDEGGVAYMPAGASSFTKITAGLPASDIRIMAIGCSNTEVWAGIDRACPPGGCISPGILIYSMQGNFIGKIDTTNSPSLLQLPILL